MHFRLAILSVAFLTMAACHHADPADSHGVDYTPVKGEGVILEINVPLNYVMMKTTEGPRKAWWDAYSQFYEGPTQVHSLGLSPGDHVLYQGVEAYKEIYIHQLIQPDGK